MLQFVNFFWGIKVEFIANETLEFKNLYFVMSYKIFLGKIQVSKITPN